MKMKIKTTKKGMYEIKVSTDKEEIFYKQCKTAKTSNKYFVEAISFARGKVESGEYIQLHVDKLLNNEFIAYITVF